MNYRYLILSLTLALCACAKTDTGVGVTSDRDYTLTVSVKDRFIRMGDTIPVRVQLRRTDNSNLPSGLKGSIVLTTTDNGELKPETIPVNVTGAVTTDVSDNATFRGLRSGSAEVRAAFQDATARVEIVISAVRTP